MISTSIIMLVVLVVPVFFVLTWIVSGYNRLVALRNRYKNAFAQIDVQLKRRYDLIPNLVETAKGYIKHERAPSKRSSPPATLPQLPAFAPRRRPARPP